MEIEGYNPTNSMAEMAGSQVQQLDQQLVLNKADQEKVVSELSEVAKGYAEAIAKGEDRTLLDKQLAEFMQSKIGNLSQLISNERVLDSIRKGENTLFQNLIQQQSQQQQQLLLQNEQQLALVSQQKESQEQAIMIYKEQVDEYAKRSEAEKQQYEKDKQALAIQNQTLMNQLQAKIQAETNLSNTEQELAIVSAEKQNLNAQLNDLVSNYNMLQQRSATEVATLQQAFANVENGNKELNNLVQQANAKALEATKKAQAAIKAKEDEIARLQTAQLALVPYNEVEVKMNELNQQLVIVNEDLSNKTFKLTEAANKLALFEQNNQSLENERTKLQELYRQARDETESIRRDYNAAQLAIQKAELANQTLALQLEGAKNTNELAIVGDNDTEIKQLRTTNNELQLQLTKSQREVGDEKRKLGETKRDIGNRDGIIQSLKQQLDETNKTNETRFDEWEKERDGLKSNIRSLEEEKSRLQVDINAKIKDIERIQQESSNRLLGATTKFEEAKRQLDVEIIRLKTELSTQQNTLALANIDSSTEALRNEMERITNDLSTAQLKVETLELKLKQSTVDLEQSLKITQSLQKENADIQGKLVKSLDTERALRKESNDNTSRVLDIQNEKMKQEAAIRKIQLFDLSNDEKSITNLKELLDASDDNNKNLLRLTFNTRMTVEQALEYRVALKKLPLYVGGEDTFRNVTQGDLMGIANFILMDKGIAQNLAKKAVPKSGESSIFSIKRKPVLSLGASALHSLNFLEMAAQAEWRGLSSQLTLPGEYSVDIEFTRVLSDGTESKEFHFLLRDVPLLANPNNKESGDQFFLIDLTKPGSRVIFHIGSLGMADVIHNEGILKFVIKDQKNGDIVKEEALSYEFVPQKALQYNAKVSARLNDEVSIHSRYLGGSYILEDIIIRQ